MAHRYIEVPAMLMLLYKSSHQGYVSWGKEVVFPTIGRKGKEELMLLLIQNYKQQIIHSKE